MVLAYLGNDFFTLWVNNECKWILNEKDDGWGITWHLSDLEDEVFKTIVKIVENHNIRDVQSTWIFRPYLIFLIST